MDAKMFSECQEEAEGPQGERIFLVLLSPTCKLWMCTVLSHKSWWDDMARMMENIILKEEETY